MMYDHEMVYEKLNQEYREKRFETYEEFDSYAVNNIMNSVSMRIASYQKSEHEGYTQYTCADQNNNYYIFYITDIMNYTLILDTYTIDLPEFVEEYNSADDARKVQLNISKVFEAINDGDYRYVYNKLDETFRNNTYGSLENFRVYMEENFYEENDIEYLEFSEEGDTYIYRTRIKNAAEGQSEGKEMTVIMKLLEGTNFVMSFSIG